MHVTHHLRPYPLPAAVLIAAAVIVGLVPGLPAMAAGSDDRTRTISGSVTVDSEPAAVGTALIGEALTEDSVAPIQCGEATVADDGTFRMPLAAACEPGMAMRLRLTEPSLEAKDQIELTSGDIDNALVRFEQQAPVDGAAQISATLADAEAAPSEPLIEDTALVLLLGLIAAAAVALLAFVSRQWVAVAKSAAAIRPGDVTSDHEVKMAQARLDQLSHLSAVIPKVLIEGLVLALAIIAIVVLGASAKLTSEGLVSVLAAIVGYAAGRSTLVQPR